MQGTNGELIKRGADFEKELITKLGNKVLSKSYTILQSKPSTED